MFPKILRVSVAALKKHLTMNKLKALIKKGTNKTKKMTVKVKSLASKSKTKLSAGKKKTGFILRKLLHEKKTKASLPKKKPRFSLHKILPMKKNEVFKEQMLVDQAFEDARVFLRSSFAEAKSSCSLVPIPKEESLIFGITPIAV